MTPADIPSLVERLHGPVQWGYMCLADGGFIADDTPLEAAALLDALTSKEAELVKPPREVSGDAVGGGEAANYADYQQRRGRLPDLIEEAIGIFDEWMKDDDYDARRCLDNVTAKLKTARDWYDTPKPPCPTASHNAARERIARIIEPAAFQGDDWRMFYFDELQMKADQQRALAKADAIMAALPTTDGAGMREALTEARATFDAMRRGKRVDLTGAVERCDAALATPPTTDATERMREAEELLTKVRDGHGCQPGYVNALTLKQIDAFLAPNNGEKPCVP